MKIIKSDGRYKYFNAGYAYIADFIWRNREDEAAYKRIMDGLLEMHGPQWEELPGGSFWKKKIRNEHYVLEVNRSAKRRRIYVKNESDITMALLRS
jgi:hypothetical protein